MRYQIKKSHRSVGERLKEFGKVYVDEMKKIRKWEWKHLQIQFRPVFQRTKDVHVRDFKSNLNAVEFAEKKKKEGYNVLVQTEFTQFVGTICEKPMNVYMVYYSAKPLDKVLKVNDSLFDEWIRSYKLSHKPICAPKWWTGVDV